MTERKNGFMSNYNEATQEPRPLTPLQMRREAISHNCSQADIADSMNIGLSNSAAWWARRGATPPEIFNALEIQVKECGTPRFIEVFEVKRLAIETFQAVIAEKSSILGKRTEDDTDENLREVESLMRYRAGERFKFGISELDDGIGGGLEKGQVLSLIGNPGSMKTSLLLTGIENWLATNGGNVLFFSLDMPKTGIYERLLLRELEVSPAELARHYRDNSPLYREAKEAIKRKFGDGRFMVKENTAGKRWTPAEMKSEIEKTNPAVVAIDYVTLLKHEKQSDYDVSNEVAPMLKDMSAFYGFCSIALSQMSMTSRREQAAGGMGGSARGGGIIEEICDCELELFRDAPAEDSGDDLPRIVATIKKCRRGAAGTSYQLDYIPRPMMFTGIAHKVAKATTRKAIFGEI